MAFLMQSGKTFGVKLCEALGLPAHQISGINLDCQVKDIVRMTVKYNLEIEDDSQLLKAISELRAKVDLIPADPDTPCFAKADTHE
jgi:hypothetical protein